MEVAAIGIHHRDRTLVYRLAEKHPELREELYEFFEDLILGDSADVVPAIAEAEDRVAQWIRSSGVDVAIAAAKQKRHRTTTEPSRASFDGGVRGVEETANAAQKKPASADTWIAFLRQRVHQLLPDIAKALSQAGCAVHLRRRSNDSGEYRQKNLCDI